MKHQQTISDRILASIKRNPDFVNSRIAKNLGNCCTSADVQKIRDGLTENPLASKAEPKGIPLQSKRVISHRPVETASKFIKRLAKGRGFIPKDLAVEWGMSEETIKKHAREMGCMKYVEVEEDEWQPMIMHPETAANY